MYIPKHFSIEEFVPEHVFQERGERAWQLIDDRLLVSADQLREDLGPMIINTWHSDKLVAAYGKREWCGLRTLGFFQIIHNDDILGNQKYHESYSQHKYGRALDAVFRDVSAEEARAWVRDNRMRFPDLTAMETDVTWLHVDVRNIEALTEFAP